MIRSTTPRPPSAFSIFIAAAIVAYALGLSGCIPLAITGVAATASVATDRRSTGAQLDDELIEDKTAVQVLERFKGNDVHVNVTSYNGNVLLTGEVPFESVKTEIGQIAGRSKPGLSNPTSFRSTMSRSSPSAASSTFSASCAPRKETPRRKSPARPAESSASSRCSSTSIDEFCGARVHCQAGHAGRPGRANCGAGPSSGVHQWRVRHSSSRSRHLS